MSGYETYRDRLLSGERISAFIRGVGEKFAVRVRNETGIVICKVNDAGLAIQNGWPGTHWVRFSELSPEDMEWLIQDQEIRNEGLELRLKRSRNEKAEMELELAKKRIRIELEEKYRMGGS